MTYPRPLRYGEGAEPERAPVAERVRSRLARLVPFLPSLRDLHVYGGGILVAVGAGNMWAPLGPAVFGILLVYLGLRFRTGKEG